MSKYLDSFGVQQLWKAVTNADDAVKTIINGLDLSYDSETRHITLTGNDGKLSTSFDASDFVKDGMLEKVEIVTAQSVGGITYVDGKYYEDDTKFMKFTWNTAVDNDPVAEGVQIKVNYLKVEDIAPTYSSDGNIGISDSNVLYVEKIPTEKTKTSADIPVAGGPLADLLNKAGITSISEGTDMQALLFSLFCKELWPTWSDDNKGDIKFSTGNITCSMPQPSFTLEGENTVVEVGTLVNVGEGTISAASPSVTKRGFTGFTYGYSADNDNTKDSSNDAVYASKKVNEALSADNYTLERKYSGFVGMSTTTATPSTSAAAVKVAAEQAMVGEGTCTVTLNATGPSASITFDAMPSYFACSNVGNTKNAEGVVYAQTPAKDEYYKASDAASNSRSRTITGKRYAYTGAVTEGFVANSASVRNLTMNSNSASALTSVTAPAGNTQVIIAFPSSWGSLTEVKDNNALGAPLTDNFVLTDNVKVEGANGFTVADYKVYVYTSGVVLGAVDYTVTVK